MALAQWLGTRPRPRRGVTGCLFGSTLDVLAGHSAARREFEPQAFASSRSRTFVRLASQAFSMAY